MPVTHMLWWGAASVMGLVLVQCGLSTWDAIRRSRHRRRCERFEIEILQRRLEEARERAKAEQERVATWTGWRKFEVRRRVVEDQNQQICSFYLAPHDGRPIPGYHPGQFLTFRLRLPGDSKPVVRCYSLSDAPQPDRYRISVKRVPPPRDQPDAPPGLSSNFFHDNVFIGDIVDVKAPSGGFYLDLHQRKPVVLIGGGIGITPVLSMLNAIVRTGQRLETWVFFGFRNSGEHAMKVHLEQIARDFDHVHMHICYSNPLEEDRLDRDYHHGERVSVNLFKRLLPSNNYDFFTCGPPAMMETIEADLAAWGVPADCIHSEKFGGAARTRKAPAESAGSGPPVTFKRTGKTVNWDASADNLWEFAAAHDVHIDSGCLQGSCGTCVTAILSGEVAYKGDADADCEPGSCLVCSCAPKGPLELDA